MSKTPLIRVPLQSLDVMMPLHIVVDVDGYIQHVGPTMAKVFGDTPHIGVRMLDLFDLRRPDEAAIVRMLRAGATGKVLLKRKDRAQTQMIGVAVTLPGYEGILVNLSFGISIFDAVAQYRLAGSDFAPTDLTLELLYLAEANSAAMAESRALNMRLHGAVTQAVAEATTDTLTGLQNRRALDQALLRLIERDIPFTLAHLDLDFFKSVNDTFGHAAGDRVLVEVARVLQDETRDEDTVARVGGDEFVLVFAGLTDQQRLSTVAERIIQRLEEPISFGREMCRISATIGLVSSTQYDAPDASRMLVDADLALYESKGAGRAQFSFFGQGPKGPGGRDAQKIA